MAAPTTPRAPGGAGDDGIARQAIGERVRRMRLAIGGLEGKKISQEELARRAGLSLLTVHNLERGRVDPTLETIRKLARALDVPVGMLIEGE